MNTSIERHRERGALARDDKGPTLADVLYDRMEELQKVAGEALDLERLFQMVLITVDKSDALLRCSHVSVVRACYDAARLGLELNGVEAALVPFKGVASAMPMYQGLCKLAYEEPTVESIEARVIRVGDIYEIEEGTSPRIMHKPNLDDVNTVAKGIIYYATVWQRGRCKFDFMRRAEVEAIRLKSPSVRAGMPSPWDDHYDEMAKVRPLKRLLKTVPKRTRLRDALEHHTQLDARIVDETPIGNHATARAAAMLGSGVAGALPPPEVKPVLQMDAAEVKREIAEQFDRLCVPKGKRMEEARKINGLREPATLDEARDVLLVLRELAPTVVDGEAQGQPTGVDA